MKEEGRGSKSPLTDCFLKYPNNKFVLLALLGATMGQGVIWYTGQFYALFFVQTTMQVDYLSDLHHHRRSAAAGHAVLRAVRLAVGPHRPALHHPRRLPHRCAQLFRAVRLARGGGEPGADRLEQEHADHRHGRSGELPLQPVPAMARHRAAAIATPRRACSPRAASPSPSADGAAGSKATLSIGGTTVEGYSPAGWTKALIDNAATRTARRPEATVALSAEQLAAVQAADDPGRPADRHQCRPQGGRSGCGEPRRRQRHRRRAGNDCHRGRPAAHRAGAGPGRYQPGSTGWRPSASSGSW